METPEAPIPQPQFIVSSRDNSIKLSLEKFGRDITENPEKFLPIVSSIGSMALVGSEATYEIDGDQAAYVQHYFLYEYDYEVSYDNESEVAVMLDPVTSGLISERARVSRVHEPEQAKLLSDQIRHRRLAFFVERLIAFENQNQSEPKGLPSTG